MSTNELLTLKEQLRAVFEFKRPTATKEDVDHMILDLFFQMYCEDWISRGDLTKITKELGYEVKNDVLDDIESHRNRRIEA